MLHEDLSYTFLESLVSDISSSLLVSSYSSDATTTIKTNRGKRTPAERESVEEVCSYLHFCNEWYELLILRHRDLEKISCSFVAGKANIISAFLILSLLDGEKCSPVHVRGTKYFGWIWQNKDIDREYTKTDGKPSCGCHDWSSWVRLVRRIKLTKVKKNIYIYIISEVKFVICKHWRKEAKETKRDMQSKIKIKGELLRFSIFS